MFSGLSVSGVFEVVGELFGGVGVEQLADGGEDRLESSRRRLAQEVLELGEDLFDGFEIGRVFGEKARLSGRSGEPRRPGGCRGCL